MLKSSFASRPSATDSRPREGEEVPFVRTNFGIISRDCIFKVVDGTIHLLPLSCLMYLFDVFRCFYIFVLFS